MSVNGPTIIAVLLTAIGAMGLPITIFLIFFEVKPSQKKKISQREMIFILMWSLLLVLGIVNLYFVLGINSDNSGKQDDSSQNESSQEFIEQDSSDAVKDDESDENANLSSEELLIKQNFDLIQQLRDEYSETDIEVIESESGSVEFYIYERAGRIYQDLTNVEEYNILRGKNILSAKVVIIDYSSDEIICTLTSSDNIRYSPGNQNKFYCVVFHDDYDIYVTCPMQVVSGERQGVLTIDLEKKDCQYTPLFQLRLYMTSTGEDKPYCIASSYKDAKFTCRSLRDSKTGSTYYGSTTESGMLSWGSRTYFSLSTDYVVEVFLSPEANHEIESNHRTFDGAVTNSNQIDLYFDFNDISDSVQ